MKTKEQYLEQIEKKVKHLLSELYESESEIQKEMIKTKEELKQQISKLETQYNETTKKRMDLQEKFEQLKSVDNDQWENAQKDFDLLLKHVEGDTEIFMDKAEAVIDELGGKIQKIENNMADAASDVKNEIKKKANEL
jgi:predicted RNase H-like nuclease (RuvC/YqgF family)